MPQNRSNQDGWEIAARQEIGEILGLTLGVVYAENAESSTHIATQDRALAAAQIVETRRLVEAVERVAAALESAVNGETPYELTGMSGRN